MKKVQGNGLLETEQSSKYLGSIIIPERTSQQRHGEQSGKGMESRVAKTWRAEWQRHGEQSGKDMESRVAKTWRAEWQRHGRHGEISLES